MTPGLDRHRRSQPHEQCGHDGPGQSRHDHRELSSAARPPRRYKVNDLRRRRALQNSGDVEDSARTCSAAVGVAHVTTEVAFTVNGTRSIPAAGRIVQLGGDLSGSHQQDALRHRLRRQHAVQRALLRRPRLSLRADLLEDAGQREPRVHSHPAYRAGRRHPLLTRAWSRPRRTGLGWSGQERYRTRPSALARLSCHRRSSPTKSARTMKRRGACPTNSNG